MSQLFWFVGLLPTLLADVQGAEAALAAQTAASFSLENLWYGSLMAVVYGVIGILLTALGFKVFDWITPKLDIEKELGEKQNIAVGIVCAAALISVAIIIAVAIR